MAILERRIQKIISSGTEYNEWEKKWEVIEQRIGGFSAKRHYFLISGSDDLGTMVWEREWESFAAIEAAYGKLTQDSEMAGLMNNSGKIVGSERIEYYSIR